MDQRPLFQAAKNEFVHLYGVAKARIAYASLLILAIVIYADDFVGPAKDFLLPAAAITVMAIAFETLFSLQDSNKYAFEVLDESEAQLRLLDLVEKTRFDEAHILSSGLGSRRLLIANLVRAGISVKVITQDPRTAIDKQAAELTSAITRLIIGDIKDCKRKELEIRCSTNISSVRAVVLTEGKRQTKHVFIGWYSYHADNSEVHGSHNPTLYFTTNTYRGKALANWLEVLIAEYTTDSSQLLPPALEEQTVAPELNALA